MLPVWSLSVFIAAAGQQMPPVPAVLNDTSGVACVKLAEGGAVAEAFVAVSTGDAAKDRELIRWVRQLRWPGGAARPDLRDIWFPMPLTFGKAAAPVVPESCAPGVK
ncbi:MAG TPA: hypothetical protein VF695_02670 [Sphingomonas sp.]